MTDLQSLRERVEAACAMEGHTCVTGCLSDPNIPLIRELMAKVEELNAQKHRAVSALRDLHDEQNDAPLERRRAEWAGAMERAQGVLRDLEPTGANNAE